MRLNQSALCSLVSRQVKSLGSIRCSHGVAGEGKNMEKWFNTAGICYPEEHYMVIMDSRLRKIVQMVDKGQYFTINRGRQYGKTTMMNLLAEKLSGHYSVFSISFEGIGDELCRSEEVFCQTFLGLLNDVLCYEGVEGISEAVRGGMPGAERRDSAGIQHDEAVRLYLQAVRRGRPPGGADGGRGGSGGQPWNFHHLSGTASEKVPGQEEAAYFPVCHPGRSL